MSLPSPFGPTVRAESLVYARTSVCACDHKLGRGKTSAFIASGALGALGVLGALSIPGVATASTFYLFGAGTDGIATVGARAAGATDGSASYYNPAGLAFGEGYGAEASAVYMVSDLNAAGQSQDFLAPFGVTITGDADIPLSEPLKGMFRVGTSVYALPDALMETRMRFRDDPAFTYYDGRTSRLALVPALGVRLKKWLGFGIGANLLADLSGPSSLRPAASGALETAVVQEAQAAVAPIVGVTVQPVDELRVAAVWRQEFGAFNQVVAYSEVGGVPLTGEVVGESFYTPEAVTLALSLALSDDFGAEVDASYLYWSEWRGPLLDISAKLPGVDLKSHENPKVWQDTWTIRASGHYTARFDAVGVTVQGGVGYEPTMIVDDAQRDSMLVDGDKLLLGLGVNVDVHDTPFTVGIAGQNQQLLNVVGRNTSCVQDCDVSDESPQLETAPIGGAGSVWAFSLGMGVSFR